MKEAFLTNFNLWINAPKKWNELRLKTLVSGVTNGVWGDEPIDTNSIVCVRVADFDYAKLNVADYKLTRRSIPVEQQNGRILEKGDILIERSGGGEKQLVGRVVQYNLDEVAVCSNFISRLEIRKDLVSAEYLVLVFYALYYRKCNLRHIKQATGIQNLDLESYLEEKIKLPSLISQKLIAGYIKVEIANLDQLAEARQQQLVLLEEKRRAIIDQAVTQGIDNQTPRRDSGFPWLGSIPANWQVVRLRFLAEVRGGLTKGRKYENAQPVMLPYVRVANVQAGYLNLSDIAEIEVLEEEIERYSLKYGDVLMNEGGDADKLGRGAMWREEIKPCLHQNHVFAVRCFAVNPEWLATVSNSEYSKAYFESRARQSTNLASISSSNIKEFPVVMPPLSTQKSILAFIEQEATRVGALRAAIETSLNLLQQKRASLITAAVTGQLTLPADSYVST